MKDQTKLAVGLLAGAAIAATVGILITSGKGAAIKEEVSDYFADLIKSIKSKVQATADDLTDYKNNTVNTARSALKHKVDAAADAAI